MDFLESLRSLLERSLPSGALEILNDPIFFFIGVVIAAVAINQWLAASMKAMSARLETVAPRYFDVTAVTLIAFLVLVGGYAWAALVTAVTGAALAAVGRYRLWPTWTRWASVPLSLTVGAAAVAATDYVQPKVNVYFVLSFDSKDTGGKTEARIDAWKKFKYVLNEAFDEIPAVSVRPESLDPAKFDEFSLESTKRVALVERIKGRGGQRPVLAFYTKVAVTGTGNTSTLELFPLMYVGSDLTAHENLRQQTGPNSDADYLVCLVIAEVLEKLASRAAVKLSPEHEQRAWTNLIRVYERQVLAQAAQPALLAKVRQQLAAGAITAPVARELLASYATGFDAARIVQATAALQQQALQNRAESYR